MMLDFIASEISLIDTLNWELGLWLYMIFATDSWAPLKVNQIGSVTESIEAVRVSMHAGWGVIASHRSGETENPCIADLSVGSATMEVQQKSLKEFAGSFFARIIYACVSIFSDYDIRIPMVSDSFKISLVAQKDSAIQRQDEEEADSDAVYTTDEDDDFELGDMGF
ncbi:hypothetical protein C5167_044035 [Papaver somniferum]|uniref:phosphopyruvate hydratase n=1 Tax=Papaver somniferum TaxID=3469 RepID=A0A4Y7L9Y9_PAPSO|nr:hypothetical protein C5167_044035 [Papaver somniferum]